MAISVQIPYPIRRHGTAAAKGEITRLATRRLCQFRPHVSMGRRAGPALGSGRELKHRVTEAQSKTQRSEAKRRFASLCAFLCATVSLWFKCKGGHNLAGEHVRPATCRCQ